MEGWMDGLWAPGVGGWMIGQTDSGHQDWEGGWINGWMDGQTGKWTRSVPRVGGTDVGALWVPRVGGRGQPGCSGVEAQGSSVHGRTDGGDAERPGGGDGVAVPLPAAHPRFPPPGPRGRYGGVCSAPGAGMAVPGAGSGAIPGAGRPRASRPAPLHVTRRGGCERWGPAPLCSGTGTDPAPRRSAPAAPGKRRAAAPGAAPTVGVTGAAQQRGGPGRTRDLQPLPVPGGGWGGVWGWGTSAPMYPQAPPVCTLQIAFPLSPPNLLLLPSPPHPGPIFHPPRILIPATCPRYRRSPAWPHVWVSPPPLTSRTAPSVGEGGVHPAGFARGGGGGRFLRGAVGMGCAARGVPAAVRGAAPHRSLPPAEGAPPVSGGGGRALLGRGR